MGNKYGELHEISSVNLNNEVQIHHLQLGVNRIGCDLSAEIRIYEEGILPTQCIIQVNENKMASIISTSSLNSIEVNGKFLRKGKAELLEPNGAISFGCVKLLYFNSHINDEELKQFQEMFNKPKLFMTPRRRTSGHFVVKSNFRSPIPLQSCWKADAVVVQPRPGPSAVDNDIVETNSHQTSRRSVLKPITLDLTKDDFPSSGSVLEDSVCIIEDNVDIISIADSELSVAEKPCAPSKVTKSLEKIINIAAKSKTPHSSKKKRTTDTIQNQTPPNAFERNSVHFADTHAVRINKSIENDEEIELESSKTPIHTTVTRKLSSFKSPVNQSGNQICSPAVKSNPSLITVRHSTGRLRRKLRNTENVLSSTIDVCHESNITSKIDGEPQEHIVVDARILKDGSKSSSRSRKSNTPKSIQNSSFNTNQSSKPTSTNKNDKSVYEDADPDTPSVVSHSFYSVSPECLQNQSDLSGVTVLEKSSRNMIQIEEEESDVNNEYWEPIICSDVENDYSDAEMADEETPSSIEDQNPQISTTIASPIEIMESNYQESDEEYIDNVTDQSKTLSTNLNRRSKTYEQLTPTPNTTQSLMASSLLNTSQVTSQQKSTKSTPKVQSTPKEGLVEWDYSLKIDTSTPMVLKTPNEKSTRSSKRFSKRSLLHDDSLNATNNSQIFQTPNQPLISAPRNRSVTRVTINVPDSATPPLSGTNDATESLTQTALSAGEESEEDTPNLNSAKRKTLNFSNISQGSDTKEENILVYDTPNLPQLKELPSQRPASLRLSERKSLPKLHLITASPDKSIKNLSESPNIRKSSRKTTSSLAREVLEKSITMMTEDIVKTPKLTPIVQNLTRSSKRQQSIDTSGLSINKAQNNMIGVRNLFRTPKITTSPMNDLTNVSGVKRLLKTPKNQTDTTNDLDDMNDVATPNVAENIGNNSRLVHSLNNLFESPHQDLSTDDQLNSTDVNESHATPKMGKSPKNDLTNVSGVKKLLKTPISQRKPTNELEDVDGVKELFKTPNISKAGKSPKNDLTNVSGVKKLLKTPKPQNESKNNLEDLEGVQELLKTPLLSNDEHSTKNDLSNVNSARKPRNTLRSQKVEELEDFKDEKLSITPASLGRKSRNDLSNVSGVKKLLKTPKSQDGSNNGLEDLEGVKELLRTPLLSNVEQSAKNNLSNLNSARKLRKTPRSQIEQELEDIEDIKQLSKTPASSGRKSRNDLNNVSGVKLLKTPKPQKEPHNDLVDVDGVEKLFETPNIFESRNQHSSVDDLTDVTGVKRLYRTPNFATSSKNDLTKVSGVKHLFESPKQQRSPLNDFKKMFAKSKISKSPKNDLTMVRCFNKYLKTLKLQNEPKNDLTDVEGVKKLFTSPKITKTPNNDLRDVRGVKRLLEPPKKQRSPNNDLTDVFGTKKLFATPKLQNSPRNDLSNVVGVRTLMRTPKIPKVVEDILDSTTGIPELMQSEKSRKRKRSDQYDVKVFKKLLKMKTERTKNIGYEDVAGVKRMFNEAEAEYRNVVNVSGVADLFQDEFDKLVEKKPVRKYPGKTSPVKSPLTREHKIIRNVSQTEESHVEKWVKDQNSELHKEDKNNKQKQGRAKLSDMGSPEVLSDIQNKPFHSIDASYKTSTPITKPSKENIMPSLISPSYDSDLNSSKRHKRTIRVPSRISDGFILNDISVKFQRKSKDLSTEVENLPTEEKLNIPEVQDTRKTRTHVPRAKRNIPTSKVVDMESNEQIENTQDSYTQKENDSISHIETKISRKRGAPKTKSKTGEVIATRSGRKKQDVVKSEEKIEVLDKNENVKDEIVTRNRKQKDVEASVEIEEENVKKPSNTEETKQLGINKQKSKSVSTRNRKNLNEDDTVLSEENVFIKPKSKRKAAQEVKPETSELSDSSEKVNTRTRTRGAKKIALETSSEIDDDVNQVTPVQSRTTRRGGKINEAKETEEPVRRGRRNVKETEVAVEISAKEEKAQPVKYKNNEIVLKSMIKHNITVDNEASKTKKVKFEDADTDTESVNEIKATRRRGKKQVGIKEIGDKQKVEEIEISDTDTMPVHETRMNRRRGKTQIEDKQKIGDKQKVKEIEISDTDTEPAHETRMNRRRGKTQIEDKQKVVVISDTDTEPTNETRTTRRRGKNQIEDKRNVEVIIDTDTEPVKERKATRKRGKNQIEDKQKVEKIEISDTGTESVKETRTTRRRGQPNQIDLEKGKNNKRKIEDTDISDGTDKKTHSTKKMAKEVIEETLTKLTNRSTRRGVKPTADTIVINSSIESITEHQPVTRSRRRI